MKNEEESKEQQNVEDEEKVVKTKKVVKVKQVKEITKEMRKELDKPLPEESIKQHPTKPYLSTINAIFVVERLNDVFGIGKWFIRNEIVESTNSMVIIKSVLTVPEYGIRIENFGGNDNKDKGDAYKGAATDALTKIGSYLGIGADVWKSGSDEKDGQSKQTINLLKKHGLDPEQVFPKCNKCGATMKLREGTRGAFWACPNYKTDGTGCSNTYDINNVDIEGNLNSSPKQSILINKKSSEEINLDEIPF